MNIREIMWDYYEDKEYETVLKLMRHTSDFLGAFGLWDDRIELGTMTLYAAREAKEPFEECWLLVDVLGWVHLRRGAAETGRYVREGLAIALAAGYTDYHALALCYLAEMARHEGDFDQARSLLDQAEALHPSVQYLARIASQRGDLANDEIPTKSAAAEQQAREQYERALDLRRRVDPVNAKSTVSVVRLAALYRRRKEYDDARSLLQEALQSAEQIGNLYRRAYAQLELAELFRDRGDRATALDYARRSAESFLRLGMRREQTRAEELIADLEHESGPAT